MSVRSHVVVAGVDDRLRPHPDLEHGGTQDVAGVVRLDLKLVVNFRHLGRDQTCKTNNTNDVIINEVCK